MGVSKSAVRPPNTCADSSNRTRWPRRSNRAKIRLPKDSPRRNVTKMRVKEYTVLSNPKESTRVQVTW
jgi:hypothetical protein